VAVIESCKLVWLVELKGSTRIGLAVIVPGFPPHHS